MDVGMSEEIKQEVVPEFKPAPDAQKLEKLAKFRALRQAKDRSGESHFQRLSELSDSFFTKELLENARRYHPSFKQNYQSKAPVQNPLTGHTVTKEYRTKMVDWMIEVSTQFKCSDKAYFLCVAMFDKYLTASMQNGISLSNKDVHLIGVTTMYMASKFEDVFPLNSHTMSEKIAHGSLSIKEVAKAEKSFLKTFDFQIDFITAMDFHQLFIDYIS